jgi:hypothetical protein
MKNVTPKNNAIANIVKKVDDLILYAKDFIKLGKAHAPVFTSENESLSNRFNDTVVAIEQINLLGYLSETQFNKIKAHFYIKSGLVEKSLLETSVEFLNSKTRGQIADVVEGIFLQSENNLFIDRMYSLKNELRKCLSKEERSKEQIVGLKQPIIWEQITIILKGVEIQVNQNNKDLGDYHLYELGFPKVKNRLSKNRTVVNFFISLFFPDNSGLLDSQNNSNQKLKGSLSKILNNVFNTNKDAIEIDRHKTYRAKFITKFGGDLKINDFSSGKMLTEQDEYADYKNNLE